MKTFWLWFRWPLYAGCAFAGLIVALQLLYVLLPEPALSADSQQMQNAAAPQFVANEAGYFALGLLAPEGMEPIEYGKCRSQVLAAQQSAINTLPTGGDQSDDKLTSMWDRLAEREKACLQGQRRLEITRVLSKGELQWSDVVALAERGRIPASFEKRLNQLAIMGTVGFDPGISMLVLGSRDLSALTDLASFLSADGAVRWELGDKSGALAAFSKTAAHADTLRSGSLVDVMVANAIHARQLRIIQLLVTRSNGLAREDALQLNEIVKKADLLPQFLVSALAYEHRFSQTLRQDAVTSQLNASGTWERWAIKLSSVNRAANRHAAGLKHIVATTQTARMALAVSNAPAPAGLPEPCGTFINLQLLCLLFYPDPVGHLFSLLALPNYADYSVRLHQTVMLANAVRLSIAAREKNLVGDAFLQFANSAPANMRNPFTDASFAVDIQKRTLTLPIYVKSGALADGSTLMLPI